MGEPLLKGMPHLAGEVLMVGNLLPSLAVTVGPYCNPASSPHLCV